MTAVCHIKYKKFLILLLYIDRHILSMVHIMKTEGYISSEYKNKQREMNYILYINDNRMKRWKAYGKSI